jgi:hypothetical protein
MMHELFPVVAGAVAGLAVRGIRAPRLRLIALAALAVVIGTLASIVSGEVELSLGFIPVDVVQTLIAGGLMLAGRTAWAYRPGRLH